MALQELRVALDAQAPVHLVAEVDAEILGLGDGDVRVGEQELADEWIEGEAVDAVARRVDEHRARAVGDIAGRDEVAAGLEELGLIDWARLFFPPIDPENGAHRHVEIDVGRAVKRVEDEQILAHRILIGDAQEVGVLLGGQSGQPAGVVREPGHGQVGEAVELHDRLALDVRVAGEA